MKKFLFAFILILSIYPALSQQKHYSSCFNQAYQYFPEVPRGLLEAVAYTQTHVRHLDETETESCAGLPRVYGVMGLTLDGKNYFKSNLKYISRLTGFTINEIKQSPLINILAYAKAFSSLLQNEKNKNDYRTYARIIKLLSEIPDDSSEVNQFALDAHVYSVFMVMNDVSRSAQFNFPQYQIDLQAVFGTENYKVLSASKVNISTSGIKDENGNTFKPALPSNLRSSQFAPAIWTPAPSCNYSSRNGTLVSAITIHTIQGTYAGAISWAQNCNSGVSYHYVIRHTDGQVTQMVDEANKAWHVGSENPYTIGYEHDGYVSDPTYLTTALYNSSAAITRDICNSGYGINPLRTYYGASSSGSNVLGGCTKIKGHQHYPNQTHTDPGIYWDWDLYYHLVNNNPTITTVTTTSGTFYDSGGSTGNYADDERKLTLIAPPGATSVSLTFSAFNIELNWDYMFIYDGSTTSAPLIGVYTGTVSPGTVTSTAGSMLIEFRSDCNTVQSGWAANYTSNATPPPSPDIIAPTTSINTPSSWVTQNFTATFTDNDNSGGSGVEKSFYQVIDYDGNDWRANAARGFFSDNFDLTTIHPDWTSVTGTWVLNNSNLVQTDETQNNTNIYASLDQTLSNRYLYNWAGKMEGTGTNRRAGFHYFCDQPTLTNRGNSYFVWFRLDNDKIELYEVINDVFSLVTDVNYNFNAAQWYDFKVIYDRISGKTQIYVDNVQLLVYTDATPLATGNSISFRSGNSNYAVNNLKVYRSRANTVTVQVGSTGDLRYQNTNPTTPAGRIKSIINDNAGNLSALDYTDINVDWTVPSNVVTINDGNSADIDITYNSNTLNANWTATADVHSDIARYWYAIGTTPGGTDTKNWTDNFWYDTVTASGLTLNYGTTYYFSVKSENTAGLMSAVTSSDGQLLQVPSSPPVADYYPGSTIVCNTDSVHFTNNSTNATTYVWTFTGGSPATSNLPGPVIHYSASGNYTVQLIASGPGGSDTLINNYFIEVNNPPQAAFNVLNDTVYLPSGFAGFTNQSLNADGYSWDFGDGGQSTDINPWHQYTNAGIYQVYLIAVNNGCANDTAVITMYVLNGNGIETVTENKLIVYPNPAHEWLVIEADFDLSESEIEIFDITGRLILKPGNEKISGKQTMISLHEIASGTYAVRIRNKENQGVYRFIKR